MKIFNVGRPKKASLDLSLNAIVILILAIAILGLGLTFIRGIFKGITAKVEEAVSAGEITNPPTRDNPVTVTPSTLTIRTSESGRVQVAFMNILPATAGFTLGVFDSAGTSITNSAEMIYSISELQMEKDQINIWTIAIPTNQAAGTRLYTAKITCSDTLNCPSPAPSYSRDVILTVKS